MLRAILALLLVSTLAIAIQPAQAILDGGVCSTQLDADCSHLHPSYYSGSVQYHCDVYVGLGSLNHVRDDPCLHDRS